MSTVMAALVTGCFAVMVAWNLPEQITGLLAGSLSPTQTPSPSMAAPTDTPAPTAAPTDTQAARSAQFQEVWPEYNVIENDQKGMVIHLKFAIDGFEGVPCMAAAYFHYDSGAPLRDDNGAYRDSSGNVAAWNYFTPGYESTRYDDLTIFIPYDEFHLETGVYDLKYTVTLFTEDSQEKLANSGFYGFSFDK